MDLTPKPPKGYGRDSGGTANFPDWGRFSMGFALWLTFPEDVGSRLRDHIGRLSQRFSTPRFEPHITLLGAIRLEEPLLLSKCSLLAAELRPLDTRLVKAASANEFFRSLFIEVERSAALLHARKRALEIFDIQEPEPYAPHVSLLYGDIAPAQKRDLAGELWPSAEIIRISSLDLFEITGPPKDWRRVAHFSLADNRPPTRSVLPP